MLLAAAGTEEDDPAGVQLLLRHKARVDARDRPRPHAPCTKPRSRATPMSAARCWMPARTCMRATARAARRCWTARGRRHLPALEVLLVGRRRCAGLRRCGCQCAAPRLRRRGAVRRAGAAPAGPAAWTRKRWMPKAAVRWTWPPVRAAGRWPTCWIRRVHCRCRWTSMTTARRRIARRCCCCANACWTRGHPANCCPWRALLAPAERNGLLADPEIMLDVERVEWLLRRGADAGSAGAGHADAGRCGVAAWQPGHRRAARAVRAWGFACRSWRAGACILAACFAERSWCGWHARSERFAIELLERGADPYRRHRR